MTQAPPAIPDLPDLAEDGPTAQALHIMSHALAQIAAELHSIRVLVEGLAPVAQAYGRGGKLAAAVAARQQRKDRTP